MVKVGDKVICNVYGYRVGIVSRIGKTISVKTEDGFRLAERVESRMVRPFDANVWCEMERLSRDIKNLRGEIHRLERERAQLFGWELDDENFKG